MSATDAPLERTRELARLGALIDAARTGRGGVAVIEGPAGIGKTTLLRHVSASAAGMTVLAASGGELEHEFGFGVARQLLERAAAGRLEGAAALAAPALGLGAPDAPAAASPPVPAATAPAAAPAPAGASRPAPAASAPAAPPAPAPPSSSPPAAADARFAALHGLYWLVAILAAERPVLLAVDDAQWADEPSLRFLAYLARRVGELPVAIIVAARPPLPGEDRAVLEAIAAAAGEPLMPAPLTAAAIAALAARRFRAPPGDAFVEACLAATAGNALLVEEVLAELEAPDAGAIEAAGAERIGRRVARQLSELGGPLVAAVAILGDDCELALAAALAELSLDDARTGAAELVAADVLADAPTLRFRHPLIRAAVAERLPAVELGRAHARAARLVGGPPGVVAAHLLLAPAAGDPWAVEALLRAAEEARAQGEPGLAARYLRRALAESPPSRVAGADVALVRERDDDALAEPPPDRVAILLALARAEHVAGDPRAPARFEEAWRATGSPEVALELTALLAEHARWAEAAAVARTALAALTDGGERTSHDMGRLFPTPQRETGLHLLARLADCVRMDPSLGSDEPARLRALARTLDGSTPGERHVQASAAVITPVDTAAEHAQAAQLARRVQADIGRSASTGIVSNLIRAGQLDAAQEAAEAALEEARRGGLIQHHAAMLAMRGWVWLERGELADARDDLEGALALAPGLALPPVVVATSAALLAVVLAEQGEYDHADELLAGHELARELPVHQVMNLLLWFRARVRLLQGRTDEALGDARAVGRRYERMGIIRAVPSWRSQVAILTADKALARTELELATRWGTPLARGLALRGLGLVTGDHAALRSAVAELASAPNRLELARAQVALGAALRRDNRRAEAREPLRAGMGLAHACGARPLAEHARTELLATGARPRRLALHGADALTPSEKRITALAAQGKTNRQIAQALFVTTATVETHLRHAFRKLDISSRAELSR